MNTRGSAQNRSELFSAKIRQPVAPEKAVHMCGAVKIDQKLIFFHTRGRRFARRIAKNASEIQMHELGEIGMSVKWLSSRK